MKTAIYCLLLTVALFLQGCASMDIDPETRAFFYEGWRNPKERDNYENQLLTTP